MKKKLLILTLCLTMTASMLTGCGKKEEEPTEVQTEVVEKESETEETEVEETREGMKKSLLTGEWIDEAIAEYQPIAMMIENTKVALPQYGITKADVIYECPVEGGITRLMAIFQDYQDMERIGNIRSCRPYYAYLAREYDAFYLHAGASKEGDEVLAKGVVKDINANAGKGSQFFYRSDDERKAPHNLYISSEGIQNAIEALEYDTKITDDYSAHNLFAKSDQVVELTDGIDAKVVSLYFFDNKPWFEFNDEDQLYYRYEFKEPQIDANNNEQVKVKNIILQYVDSSFYSEKKGTLKIKLKDGGSGKYITNGKAIDITWQRGEEDKITRYYDLAGNEIVLNPGKTWISLIQNPYVEKNQYYASVEEYLNPTPVETPQQ